MEGVEGVCGCVCECVEDGRRGEVAEVGEGEEGHGDALGGELGEGVFVCALVEEELHPVGAWVVVEACEGVEGHGKTLGRKLGEGLWAGDAGACVFVFGCMCVCICV